MNTADRGSSFTSADGNTIPHRASVVQEGPVGDVLDYLSPDEERAIRRNVVADRPEFGADSYLISMMANDRLAGVERSDAEYEDLKRVLGSQMQVGDAMREAGDLIDEADDAFTSQTMRHLPKPQAVREMARRAEQKSIQRNLGSLFLKSARFGSALGGAASEGWEKAIKRAVINAPGYDLQQMIQDTGADLVKTLLDILPEKFAPQEDDPVAAKKPEEGGGDGDGGDDAFVGPPDRPTWEQWEKTLEERLANYFRVIEAVYERNKVLAAEKERRAAIAKLKAEHESEEKTKLRDDSDTPPPGTGQSTFPLCPKFWPFWDLMHHK